MDVLNKISRDKLEAVFEEWRGYVEREDFDT
jgi:hypothetical protein